MLRFIPVLFVLGLAGCAALGTGDEPVGAETPAEVESLVETDAGTRILYRLLAAEIAGQRGDVDYAASVYLDAADESPDPAVAERAARLALYAGRDDLALRASARWQTLDPAAVGARQMAALAALRSGDVERTVEALESSLPTDPRGEEQALAEIAALLTRHADADMALAVAAALAEALPHARMAHYLHAQMALESGEADVAIAAVERALSQSPDWREATLLGVEALLVDGRREAAIGRMRALASSHPAELDLQVRYARTLVRAGRNESALDVFEKLLETAPRDSRVLQPAGLLALEMNRSDQAREWLGRLEDTGREADLARYYLGRLAEIEQQPEVAMEYYGRTGGRFRDEAALRMAAVLGRQGDVDEARERLARLREDQSDRVEASWLVEGELLRGEGRYEDALTVYDQALEAVPENSDLLYARALTLVHLDRIEDAEADLRAVLEQDPDDAFALNALGYTLADRTDRLDEAESLIVRAFAQRPDNPAIIDSMGWVAYRKGRLQEALEYLQRAYRLSDGDHEVAAHLGEVLWVLGREEEAREVFERALREHPDSDLLQQVWERLRP